MATTRESFGLADPRHFKNTSREEQIRGINRGATIFFASVVSMITNRTETTLSDIGDKVPMIGFRLGSKKKLVDAAKSLGNK